MTQAKHLPKGTQLLIVAEKSLPEMSAQVVRRSLNYARLFDGRFEKIHYVSAFDLEQVYQEIDKAEKIEWHCLFTWRRQNKLLMSLTHLWFYIRIFFYSYRLIQKNEQIRIITHPFGHSLIGLVVVLLAKATNRKSVIRIAAEETSITLINTAQNSGNFISKISYSLFSRIERYVFQHADRIITVSPHFLDQVHTKRYSHKTTVMPNIFPVLERFIEYDIEPAIQQSVTRKYHIRALFVGRLSPEKGIHVLINALTVVPSIHCRIVGSGKQGAMLEAQVEQLGLADQITFEGILPQPEVWALMQESDVLLLPSYSEYTPNVIIEAGVLGVPAIASRVGGIPYMIEHQHTGLLCNPREPDSLAEQLLWLIDNPDKYQQLRRNVRMHMYQSYSAEILHKQADDFLNNLLALQA